MKSKKMWIAFPHYLYPSGMTIPLAEYRFLQSKKNNSEMERIKKVNNSLRRHPQNLHWREL
ncbi:MAG: hypothetical protein AB1847_06185 [bacterium]